MFRLYPGVAVARSDSWRMTPVYKDWIHLLLDGEFLSGIYVLRNILEQTFRVLLTMFRSM